MKQRDDITLPDAINGLKNAYISLRNIKNDISVVMSRIEEIIYGDEEENDEEDMYIEKTNYHIDYGARFDESKFCITKDEFDNRMQEVGISTDVKINTEVEGFDKLIDSILCGVTLKDNKYPDYMLKPDHVWYPKELIDSETNTWVWVIRKLIS